MQMYVNLKYGQNTAASNSKKGIVAHHLFLKVRYLLCIQAATNPDNLNSLPRTTKGKKQGRKPAPWT